MPPWARHLGQSRYRPFPRSVFHPAGHPAAPGDANPVPPPARSYITPAPPTGLISPVRALLPEITNLVAEFRRVAIDSARALSGTLATLPSADIVPFSRSAGVSIDHWLDQMEFRLKSLNIPSKLWVPGVLPHGRR